MGLMDKFKNLFTDEEIIEEEEEIEEPVKIKEIKKEEPKEENKLPTFMREKIEKEENQRGAKNDFVPDFSMNKETNVDSRIEVSAKKSNLEPHENLNNNFKFPIAFEESDFKDVSRVSRQAMRSKKTPDATTNNKLVKEVPVSKKSDLKKETKVSQLYKDKKKKEKEEKRFKATPIISPIYGVLDKNYRTEELEPIVGDNYEVHRPSKNVDFDSVRKKAYGSLADDIKENLMCENCEYLKKAKACKKEINEDNLMYEALCEKEDDIQINDAYRDITLDEATENYFDYGVEYEKVPEKSSLDKVEVDDHIKKEKNKNSGVPPVKSSINLLSTLKKSMGDEKKDNNINVTNTNKDKQKKLELTDDLFSLIDSMYDEGKE